MARTKGSSDVIDPRLDGKPYKAALQKVAETTVLRLSDLEDKAFELLDVLHERGRAEEACQYVKEVLLTVQSRAKIQSMKRYTYSLLRGFDEEAYAAMKEGRGEPLENKRKADRAAGKEARASARAAKIAMAAEATPHGALTPGPVNQASPATSPKSPGKVVALLEALGPLPSFPKAVATDRVPPPPPPLPQISQGGAAAVFKPSAEEFVPGKPWASAASLRPEAPVFLPAQTWTAPLQSAGAPIFRPAAPEFVPGQPTWSFGGSAASSAPKPQQKLQRGSKQLKQEATEFVPGQPAWAGAAGGGSPVGGKGFKVKSGKDNKKGGGNSVPVSSPAKLAANHQGPQACSSQPARPPREESCTAEAEQLPHVREPPTSSVQPALPLLEQGHGTTLQADDRGSSHNGSTVNHVEAPEFAESQSSPSPPVSAGHQAVEPASPPAPRALPRPPAAPEGSPAELIHVDILQEEKLAPLASQNATVPEKAVKLSSIHQGDGKILLVAACVAAAAAAVIGLFAFAKRRPR